jgi:hypothetical protein
MHSFLLSLLFLLQGIPIQAQQGGTVTGMLRDAAGKPVSGVRVAAVAVPQSPADAQTSTAMGAIAETDANGQYRLENVPPGRYYIAAGRLDLPTYYPGTQGMGKGTVVVVTAGSASTQINFTLQGSSAGRATSFGLLGGVVLSATPSAVLPIEVRIENGGTVPVFSPAGFMRLLLEPLNGGPRTTLSPDIQRLQVPGPGPLDYRVAVENMPPGYSIKSMTYDGASLRTGALHLPAGLFAAGGQILAPAGATGLQVSIPLVLNSSSSPSPTGPPLVITLLRSADAPGRAQVRGAIPVPATRSIYLSGKPGIVFSDGTFEFRDVPPGRHSIVTLNGSPLAASVVVGDSDLDGVQLESTPALPVGIRDPAPPATSGTRPPGTIPLVSLRGSALNQDTQQPLANGIAFLTGGAFGASRLLSEDGTFEFSPLVPGSYNVEVMSLGFETVRRTVVVEDGGSDIRFDAMPASR